MLHRPLVVFIHFSHPLFAYHQLVHVAYSLSLISPSVYVQWDRNAGLCIHTSRSSTTRLIEPRPFSFTTLFLLTSTPLLFGHYLRR